MTAHANSLTDRATMPVADAGWRWTAPATEFRVLMNALRALGYDIDTLLASVGLRASDLNDPDRRIPCELYGMLLSQAQQQRFTPNLSLELASRTPLGAFPLLDYLVITSDNVGAGVRQLARYFRLVGNPVVIDLHEGVDAVRIEIATPAIFSLEYVAALTVLHLKSETDGRFSPAFISFRHDLDDAAGFEQMLGCPIRAGASWNGIRVPLEVWNLPLRRRDPVLRQVLESQANEILARLPVRAGLALEVQRALTPRVAGGDTRVGSIARQLAMSGRTLQRRLAAEGVSYQELLDDARKEAAGRFLSESTLAIGEVAYLTGYSEPAPFHRAFKRWYGVTPEVFRMQRRTSCANTTN